MKQLERAQLKAVKGGDGWILLPGGVRVEFYSYRIKVRQ